MTKGNVTDFHNTRNKSQNRRQAYNINTEEIAT